MPATKQNLQTRLKVGMEIHVELATRSKMFTDAPNVAHPDYYDAEPNTLTDPLVLGMPGTLPVINQHAVEMAMMVGMALGCHIAGRTKWDRKSYFYPDLPKNYQISQYDMPLCESGALEIPTSEAADAATKSVRITRAHLEEDAGKLMHEAPGGYKIDHSIVDLNRAGTPLLEIVTEPDLSSPEECVMFGQTLRDICRHLGVSEGIMQRGHMRFEPNINMQITRNGETHLTPIVEIKNLNSFRALHAAVAYEQERQVEDWLDTGVAHQPGVKTTRGWDDQREITLLQREKEEAHDYRYFPDPDLVPVEVGEDWQERVRARIPELPLERYRRYRRDYELDPKDAEALVDEIEVARYFERILETGLTPKRAATVVLNWAGKFANERDVRPDQLGVEPARVKQIENLLQADKLSANAAEELFGHCIDNPETAPEQLAQEKGLLQVSDTSALESYIEEVINDPNNARAVEDVKAGKDKAIGALMGQIMKRSKGQANPKMVTQLIKDRLQQG
jgi:aspartyl-tRNA(Asn)/glutamyl-tRNA(Gln) amidotransferase subunit B